MPGQLSQGDVTHRVRPLPVGPQLTKPVRWAHRAIGHQVGEDGGGQALALVVPGELGGAGGQGRVAGALRAGGTP